MPIGFVHGFGELFADDGHFGGRFDADADAAIAQLDHGDGDFVADENTLANFSTENKHRKTLILGFWAVGIAYNVAMTGGNCKESASNLPAVGGVGGGDARAGLEPMLSLG